jgi:hypothetical protein
MNIDYYRRKRFVEAFVDEYNVGYKEDSKCTCPNTDGSTINMPVYSPEFTAEQETNWMQALVHECYHNLPDNRPDFDLIKEKDINMSSPFGFVLNVVVDHNIENKEHGKLLGADRYTEKSYDNIFSELTSEKIQQFEPIVQAVMAYDMIARSTWLTPSDYNIREKISVEANTMLTKMMLDDTLMSDYLTPRSGGLPNYELTKRLITEAADEQTQEEMEQQAKGEGDSGEGEKGEGEGEEHAKGKHEVDYSSLQQHSGEALSASEIGSDITIHYKDSDFGSGDQYEPLATTLVKPNGELLSRGERDLPLIQGMMHKSLSIKIRNYLKAMSQARYTGGKKKGKINKRAIASISTGNDRVFRTKEVKPILDTAVTLLVDSSGSMAGTKYSHAVAATTMLSETLTKLSVQHEVIGFACNYRNCWSNPYKDNVMYVHKKFTDSVDGDKLITNMLSSNVRLMDNSDGDSINVAHDRLIRQKQKRKVLIVLSDGSPAGGPHNCEEYTRKVIQEIERKSSVEIVGIGIEDRNVEWFYSNHCVIQDASQLEDKLLTVLKEMMTQ